MASQVSFPTKNNRSLPTKQGEHIPKLNLQISSELSSKKKDKSNSRNFQHFPVRSTQRPRSLKRSADSTSRPSTRTGSSTNVENLRRVKDGGKSILKNSAGHERQTMIHSSKANDINEYIKNYANSRISGGPEIQREIILLERRRNLSEKKNDAKIRLNFTTDVVSERSEAHLLSYPGPNRKELFNFPRIRDTQKPRRKLKPFGITARHQVCLPHGRKEGFLRPDTSYLHSASTSGVDQEFYDHIPTSTTLWEKYVLSLVSKNTAQWIANRCTAGENRSHLIEFLDEMYEEKNEANGSTTVRKLLENDDDCITVAK